MKNRMIALLLSCVISVLSVSAFAEKPLTIVTTIAPLGALVNSIVGERGTVDVLLENQGSGHHYALTIADRQKLVSADVALWVGKDLEVFLTKPIQQRVTRQKAVVTAMDIAAIDWPDSHSNESAHEDHHGHDHGEHDPHVWLNPINNVHIIDALVKEFVQIDPANAQYYQDNAEQQKAQLYALDKRVMDMMAPLQKIPFIVSHPAYTHFVHRYHLQQADFIAITPEKSSGAKHLVALRQLKQVRCVFNDFGVQNKKAEQLAQYLNASLAILDPMGIKGDVSTHIDARLPTTQPSDVTHVIAQLANDFHACLSGAVQ